MKKTRRDRAWSPVNPVDTPARQEVCPEGLPNGPTNLPPGAERRLVCNTPKLKSQTSMNLVPFTFVLLTWSTSTP